MSNFKCGISSGWGGEEFADDIIPESSKVIEVRIRAGSRIDAVKIVHELSSGERFELPQHGGNGGELKVLTLDDDEYLIGLEGTVARSLHKRETPTVHTLRLRSNKQLFPAYGQGGQNPYDFHYEAPTGTEIAGFIGRKGTEIGGIGVILRNRS